MQILPELFKRNRDWAHRVRESDPEFFQRLSLQQTPRYMWIGCADSRVPADRIAGLQPGEVFVHRNVANVVIHTDLNCLSVLQYAVEVLKVDHVIVCGHYGCGGIAAAMQNVKLGLIDNWLRHVRDVQQKHAAQLAQIGDPALRLMRLCELNVIEQVVNVCQTTIIQDAWDRGQAISIHGWVYALQDGLLRNLHMGVEGMEELATAYEQASQLPDKYAEGNA